MGDRVKHQNKYKNTRMESFSSNTNQSQQSNSCNSYSCNKDRRHFLKTASLSAVGATLMAGHLFTGNLFSGAGHLAADTQIPASIAHMNAYEYQVLNHLMQIAIPVQGTALPEPNNISAMTTLDQALLAGMEPHILAELKAGIKFFDEGPRKNYQNKTFTQLSAPEAVEFCDRWANSNSPQERGIVMGLKKLVGLSYWSNPATWPTLGYIGPISKRKGIPSLGNTPLPL